MRAGRLPEDHPLEKKARQQLRERALQERGQAQPRKVAVIAPQNVKPQPKRWE